MAGWKIEVTGLRQIMDALAETDKKAVKIITKEITDAGKSVAKSAAERVGGTPVSRWGGWIDSKSGRDLAFDPDTVRSSYKLRRSSFRKRGVSRGIGWDVYQTNAAGAIFEVMGDGSRVTTASGAHLVSVINSRFPGRQPRNLIPAYYAGMPEGLDEKIADQILTEARKAGLV